MDEVELVGTEIDGDAGIAVVVGGVGRDRFVFLALRPMRGLRFCIRLSIEGPALADCGTICRKYDLCRGLRRSGLTTCTT